MSVTRVISKQSATRVTSKQSATASSSSIGNQWPDSYSYLLDTYTTAAVAFSMRKLRSAYSGDCIRVRRSSDDAEQDIGFSNNLLDTSSMLTFVGANDGFITTWYDQSGNGLNITHNTAANQPQIVTSGGLYQVGSIPYYYNSTNTLLKNDNGFGSVTTGFQFFGVLSTTQQTNRGIMGNWTGAAATSSFVSYMHHADSKLSLSTMSGGSVYNTQTTFTTPTISDIAIISVFATTTDSEVFGDGLSIGTDSYPSINDVNPAFAVGTYQPNNTSIGITSYITEIILYKGNPHTQADINTSLNDYYEIY